METKEYSNGEVTIIWDVKKCTHAGICVKSLPKVYNPKERPWIKPQNASSYELINQVSKCPSGALRIKKIQNTIRIEQEDDGKKGRFTIYEDNLFAGEMTYVWAGKLNFIIDHTGIEKGFEGKSFGEKLVMQSVVYARENSLNIMPLCPFANAVFKKHAEIQDVLKK